MKKKLAIVWGIDTYGGYGPSNLVGCVDFDANKVRYHLESEGYDVLYFANDTATYHNITGAFDYVSARAQPGDDVVIYVSSHGASLSTNKQALCLYDRLFIDQDFIFRLRKIKGNVRSIIDACNSEGMFKMAYGIESGIRPKNFIVKAIPEAVAKSLEWETFDQKAVPTDARISILAAANKFGFSYATETGSLMTQAMLEGLQDCSRWYTLWKRIFNKINIYQMPHWHNETRNWNLLRKPL